MNRSALILASGVLVLSTPGCGSSGDETEPVTFEGYVGSFITDYDPASSLSDLSARSTVATKAQLIDIEDGAIFGSSPDDETANHSINLIWHCCVD